MWIIVLYLLDVQSMLSYTACTLFVYVIHATAACMPLLILIMTGEHSPPQPTFKHRTSHCAQSGVSEGCWCICRPAENGVLHLHSMPPAATSEDRLHATAT